jgi:hypothetical protein
VVATGSGTLRYQWFRNAVEIGGATSTSLELVNVAAGDAGIYTVRISNEAGSRLSDPANLTVTISAEAAHLRMILSDRDPSRLFLVITGTAGARYRLESAEQLEGWRREFEFTMPSSESSTWDVSLPSMDSRLFRVISVP